MPVAPLPAGWVAEYKDAELAREFRAAPLGPHSPRLQRLLVVMRNRPVAGKPVFVVGDDGRSWLAQIPEHFGEPLAVRGGPYPAPPGPQEEIEAFAIRWRTLFGEELPS